MIYDEYVDDVYLRVSNGGCEEYVAYSEYINYVQNHGTVFNSFIIMVVLVHCCHI